MDPLLTGLAQLGGGFALAGVILLLHREALKAFREEMAAERGRNDTNLATLFGKMDTLNGSWREAQCRYMPPYQQHQYPSGPPTHGPTHSPTISRRPPEVTDHT